METSPNEFFLGHERELKSRIKKCARVLNLFSGTKAYFASSFICLDQDELGQWAQDFLQIKKLVCTLGHRMGLDPEAYYSLFNLSPDLMELLCKNKSQWVPSFFRPDCILTENGPKLVDFNIDNGSMAFTAGLESKNFYKSDKIIREYIEQKYGFGLDASFGAEREFVNYLSRIQYLGNKIQIWDIPGRSEDQKKERNSLLQFYRTQGLSIELIESESIPRDPKKGVYTFRFFAYIHFAKKPEQLRKFFGETAGLSLESADVGFSSITYDNKINMALLWSSDVQKFLTPEEIRLVTKYIPKTYGLNRLTPSQLTSVRSNREEWVLKAGTGIQGLDVHLGLELNDDQWIEMIATALRTGNSIVQERSIPLKLDIEFTDGRSEITVDGAHIMNFYYVNDKFSGVVFTVNRDRKMTKVGVVDSLDVFVALPVFVKKSLVM